MEKEQVLKLADELKARVKDANGDDQVKTALLSFVTALDSKANILTDADMLQLAVRSLALRGKTCAMGSTILSVEFATAENDGTISEIANTLKLKELPPMPGNTTAEREYNLAVHGSERPKA